MQVLTFGWRCCLPHLMAVSCCPRQHSQHAAKMSLCPVNPMAIFWFLTSLNESPWWPQNLSHHRRLTGHRWLSGLYAHPWGSTRMRSRWGGQGPGHGHTAGLERWDFPQGDHGDRRNTVLWKWPSPRWELSAEHQSLEQPCSPGCFSMQKWFELDSPAIALFPSVPPVPSL